MDHNIELEPEALRRPPELSELRKQLKELIDAASSGLVSFRTCRRILSPSFFCSGSRACRRSFFSVGFVIKARGVCFYALSTAGMLALT